MESLPEVMKNIHRLQERPVKLQEKVFEKLFEQAEIAKLTKEDMKAYEESLKAYRDNYSVIETAKNEGILEGASRREIEIAKELKKNGVSIDLIEKSTGLTRAQIEKL